MTGSQQWSLRITLPLPPSMRPATAPPGLDPRPILRSTQSDISSQTVPAANASKKHTKIQLAPARPTKHPSQNTKSLPSAKPGAADKISVPLALYQAPLSGPSTNITPRSIAPTPSSSRKLIHAPASGTDKLAPPGPLKRPATFQLLARPPKLLKQILGRPSPMQNQLRLLDRSADVAPVTMAPNLSKNSNPDIKISTASNLSQSSLPEISVKAVSGRIVHTAPVNQGAAVKVLWASAQGQSKSPAKPVAPAKLANHFTQSQLALALTISKSKPEALSIKGVLCFSRRSLTLTSTRILAATSKMH